MNLHIHTYRCILQPNLPYSGLCLVHASYFYEINCIKIYCYSDCNRLSCVFNGANIPRGYHVLKTAWFDVNITTKRYCRWKTNLFKYTVTCSTDERYRRIQTDTIDVDLDMLMTCYRMCQKLKTQCSKNVCLRWMLLSSSVQSILINCKCNNIRLLILTCFLSITCFNTIVVNGIKFTLTVSERACVRERVRVAKERERKRERG